MSTTQERLERVHREDRVQVEIDGRDDDGERREHDGEAATAKCAHEEARERDEERARERGGQAQGEKRIAREARGAGNDGDKRRLIGVAPGEVFAAGEVVKLVAKITVSAVGQQVQQELKGGQKDDQRHIARQRGARE